MKHEYFTSESHEQSHKTGARKGSKLEKTAHKSTESKNLGDFENKYEK
jgi:hypothetical protein